MTSGRSREFRPNHLGRDGQVEVTWYPFDDMIFELPRIDRIEQRKWLSCSNP
jgi:hypothetical protein